MINKIQITMKRSLIFYFLLILVYSCKTVSIQSEAQETTTSTKVLGFIGKKHSNFNVIDYDIAAIPNYDQPIKVSIVQVPFTKEAFKAYSKANKLQEANFDIAYNDSLKTKPFFLKINIADKLTLLNMFNSHENLGIKEYLAINPDLHVITGVSTVLPDSTAQLLLSAQEVFLEEVGKKSYVLNVYDGAKKKGQVSFKDGVVFTYRPSFPCWQEDSKYQLKIVDLVEDGRTCPSKTYSSAKNAKKKINYYKF